MDVCIKSTLPDQSVSEGKATQISAHAAYENDGGKLRYWDALWSFLMDIFVNEV